MRWLRVEERGDQRCYVVPDPGENDRLIVAAIAAASFDSAWPEGYGWEQWDLTVEVTVDTVRAVLPGVFARRPFRPRAEVLAMDYVRGRRCKTYVYREARGAHRGALTLDAAEYEGTRGDVERLLACAQELLTRRPRRRRRTA